MKIRRTFTTLLIALAFTAGIVCAKYLSSSGHSNLPVTSSSEGASYLGYQHAGAEPDKARNSKGKNGKASAVPRRSSEGKVHVVKDGDSIMAAVKAASPGDSIQIFPGNYHETVYIDKDDIRLIGVIEQGERATLDGKELLNDAILYSGNNIVVENLKITRYKGNGIMGQAGNNFEIRNNIIVDTGVYGIFPQLGKNGIVEFNVISGIEDAAIYVGMSDNIHVAHNDVFDSVAGIEIENSRHAIVENNYVHNNTGGILAFITPGLPIKTTYDVIIRNNFVIGNNHKNFGAPGSTVSGIPAGTGILIMAADEVIVEGNIISDNKTAGIIITDHDNAANITLDPESDPSPDKVMLLDNTMINNGYDTLDEVKVLMLTEFKSGNPDIVRVGQSRDSCILNPQRYFTLGVGKWKKCDFSHTAAIDTYLLDEPVPAREIDPSERGKVVYLGICTGCHTYTGRMIGPPVEIIQALYMDNPQGLADWIEQPTKKREDYPPMPPQNYLDKETRLAVARYMLSATN
ncbi:parallel beta-helix domain-containing protein [Thalassomonas actiniarum]|uniref:Right-handed parallel beta-helix repeat-containing protein n=1 Tax=Thalassomonas actiniarum TaxID=485447 RepID=A0AAE9YUV0_9GAMM|nr:parallel beta-helix domain-containing protein [Thalassomonas actiniarum]WDD99917.1 right-handed parallel beta-helix repeat-containing protein [Thalassomonas actiniarum]